MIKKIIFTIAIIVLISILFFVGTGATGYFACKVQYEDLCKSDTDCKDGKVCCMIHEGIGICNYKDYCQSKEFLCKQDNDCEPGTMCCISEGMDYGICNYEDRCMSIQLFSDYVSKVKPAVDKQLSPKISPTGTIIILILIAVIVFVFWRNRKISKKKKKIKR